MGTLHLHNKADKTLPQPKSLGNGRWETGYWYISETRANLMKGAAIHLHQQKLEPSFKAGIILDRERRSYPDPRDGKEKMRTVFLVADSPVLKGAVTSADAWLRNGTKWLP